VSPPEGVTVIGVVRSGRTRLADTPVQAGLNREEVARVEIDEAFVDGLEGLEEFDFLWLLTWLAGSDDIRPGLPPLRQVPLLLRRRRQAMGIFATRGPRRINPIGLSLVKVLSVEGSVVRFSGVDLLDGTPVIDVKPYVTQFDRPPGSSPCCGWFDRVELPHGATPASLDPNAAAGDDAP
jgi:tRNA-Thr(GGU) m(6)t(6)A37 methyltransferase TsaA